MELKVKNEIPYIMRTYASYLSSAKNLSKKTINEYKLDLTVFFRFMNIMKNGADESRFDEISIANIDADFINSITLPDLYSFLFYLEDERGNSSTTRARKIACLKSFFKFAHTKMKITDENVAIDLETPKKEKRLPVFMNYDEVETLIHSIKGRNFYRNRAIIMLFLTTGMRLSELCSINICDIKGDRLVIYGKGAKERTVYLNEDALGCIYTYLRHRNITDFTCDAPLFLSERKGRIKRRTVEYMVETAMENAGLSKKYTPHKLRHTAATLYYQNGVDIRVLKDILGHESISTTQIYTHTTSDQIEEAMKTKILDK